MLIIEKTALENGAHNNNRTSTPLSKIPDGWVVVPEELEEKTWNMLPFIVPIFDESGTLIDVEQGTIPEPEPEPEPEPTIDERVTSLETTKADQASVDELNEALNMILTGVTE